MNVKGKIDDKIIEETAALAKLELSEQDGLTKERARADLERILSYIETMNELDTEGIEPMTSVLPLKNVFREDIAESAESRQMISREALLANAPQARDGCFVVPKTVE